MSVRFCPIPCQRRSPCPLRPFGAPPPKGGGLYIGRFVNRPYRNYSLFISEAASLFNIHSSQRIIPSPLPSTLYRRQRLRAFTERPYQAQRLTCYTVGANCVRLFRVSSPGSNPGNTVLTDNVFLRYITQANYSATLQLFFPLIPNNRLPHSNNLQLFFEVTSGLSAGPGRPC